jgi:hypothetical protein
MQAVRSVALLSIMVAGCASKPTRTNTTATDPIPADRPAAVADAAIRVSFDSSTVRYQAESRTVVYAASDTTVPLDSIILTARLTLNAWNASTGVALAGTVERLTVTSGLGSAKSSQTLDGAFKLAWRAGPDSVFLAAQSVLPGCDQLQDTARDLLVSVFPSLPDGLSRNQSWRAMSNFKSCRAGLMIDVSSRNQIQVVSDAAPLNRRQVTVRSDATVGITGSGTQGASAVTLRGSGVVTATYLMDLADGVLRSATSQSNTRLEFDLGYRTDRLVQHTVRTITRVQ